jgi:uncharacterized membrane-anchored protein
MTATEAGAFSRGLASKVRSMRDNAYIERLTRAKEAYAAGDYRKCAQEAEAAFQHADTDEKATPLHKFLAACYTKLKNPAAASVHLKWLADHGTPAPQS